MNKQEYRGVFVFVEQVEGKAAGVGFELIGKGKELAAALETEVTAVLMGYGVEGITKELACYGADRVVMINDPALETMYRKRQTIS